MSFTWKDLVIPPPHNLGYNWFALSRPSVGRSVRPASLSCPLYKYYTNWRIFFKLCWNVNYNKGIWKTHVAHVSVQGHNWRSNIKQSNIKTLCHVHSISPTLIDRFSLIFAEMFTSTRGCAEPMLTFFPA